MSRTGKLFIIAAPSGAGKTSLVNAATKELSSVQISISYTTRSPRPGDQEGVDYHFVNEAAFQQMILEDALLERAKVFGYHYGTGKDWVLTHLHKGVDVILEIDWQGARQIRAQFADAVSIFILPPSMAALTTRLQVRCQDRPTVIESRMAKAQEEMMHYVEFDYIIVNDDFTVAKDDLKSIIGAERLRLRIQQQAQAQLLAKLLKTD